MLQRGDPLHQHYGSKSSVTNGSSGSSRILELRADKGCPLQNHSLSTKTEKCQLHTMSLQNTVWGHGDTYSIHCGTGNRPAGLPGGGGIQGRGSLWGSWPPPSVQDAPCKIGVCTENKAASFCGGDIKECVISWVTPHSCPGVNDGRASS